MPAGSRSTRSPTSAWCCSSVAESRSVAGTLWLDGLTASVAAAALGAALLLEVVLRTTEGSRAAVATNLAYPLGDVLLLSAVFGVFALAGWKIERRWLVLALGVLATTVADGIFLFTVDTYEEGAAVDVLWPASSLLIAAAAWVGTRASEACGSRDALCSQFPQFARSSRSPSSSSTTSAA